MTETHNQSLSADQEHSLLRATLENMSQGVAMYDASHRLVTWNERFRVYLEMPDEFLGMLVRTVVVRAVRHRHRHAIRVMIGVYQMIGPCLTRRIR